MFDMISVGLLWLAAYYDAERGKIPNIIPLVVAVLGVIGGAGVYIPAVMLSAVFWVVGWWALGDALLATAVGTHLHGVDWVFWAVLTAAGSIAIGVLRERVGLNHTPGAVAMAVAYTLIVVLRW